MCFKVLLKMDIKHQEDIEHIRSMMERSSRFISLSGKSGVLAGIVALVAAFLSYYFIKDSGADYFGNQIHQFLFGIAHKAGHHRYCHFIRCDICRNLFYDSKKQKEPSDDLEFTFKKTFS